MTGSVVNSWSAGYSRHANQITVLSPYVTPLGLQVANTGNGNWLLAVASWRQDAGTAGVLAESSTMSICDDAHNMWLPVQVTSSGAGIIRQTVWMAPAARKAQWVFASPTAYQQAATLLVMEISASVPWYLVSVVAQNFTNQSTSVTQNFTPASGVFSVGVLTWDNNSLTVTPTATGWTAGPVVTTSDSASHAGDLTQNTYTATAPGTSLTISGSAASPQDWSVLLVSVHGITDTIALPWSWPNPDWPIVITEMGFGSHAATPPDSVGWTDISTRNSSLGEMSVTRQIQYEDQTLTAGQLQMALDNYDGALTPPTPPMTSGWSFAVSGSPILPVYFIVGVSQAASIVPGDAFIATSGSTILGLFTVSFMQAPFGGFVNVFFSPQASELLSSANNVTVTQVWADDDIPFRVRTVWPWSPNPYSVLFSGFTDSFEPQIDEDLLRGWVNVTALDIWSRLTAQMLTASQEEILTDNPYALWPLGDAAGAQAGSQIAPGGVGPIVQQASKYGTGAVNFGFGNGLNTTLAGDPGATCWGQDNVLGGDGLLGASLNYLPANPAQLPPIANGVTVEFWSFISPEAASVTWVQVIAACIGARGLLWTLGVGIPGSGTSGQLLMTVYDKVTGAATTTAVTTFTVWSTTAQLAVVFTQTAWSVRFNGAIEASGTCNLPPVYLGFTFGGVNVPWQGLSGNCSNGSLADIALYPAALPQTRSYAHYGMTLNAQPSGNAAPEPDLYRIARVIGYGTLVPVLAMRGGDLQPVTGAFTPIGAWDLVTAATDTYGQVVSSYVTNMATSAEAALFADGPGVLVYRRRTEWYDRPIGQWTLGELFPAPLNSDWNFTGGVLSWVAENSATLTWSVSSALPPLFQYAGLFTGNGSAANPQIQFASPLNMPVTPGSTYQFTAAVYSPQGWPAGMTANLVWNTSLGVTSSPVTPIPTAGAGAIMVATGRAPAGATSMSLIIQAAGTPASSVQFFTGWGAVTSWTGEVPYLPAMKESLDRAQLYNAAILTQYGDAQTKQTNTGTGLTFTPTSGITVNLENAASVALRGSVPYTQSSYLANAQAVTAYLAGPSNGYLPGQGSIEDSGNWIVQTQGAPVLRGENIAIIPAATGGAAWLMALQAEVGDTATLNRRPGASQPESSVPGYLSSITYTINFGEGGTQAWLTEYMVSPAPVTMALECDNVTAGVLDGQNVLPW